MPIEEVEDLNTVLNDRVSIIADRAYEDSVVIFDREPREYMRVFIKNATEINYFPANDHSLVSAV